jgi:hypothetical protein
MTDGPVSKMARTSKPSRDLYPMAELPPINQADSKLFILPVVI